MSKMELTLTFDHETKDDTRVEYTWTHKTSVLTMTYGGKYGEKLVRAGQNMGINDLPLMVLKEIDDHQYGRKISEELMEYAVSSLFAFEAAIRALTAMAVPPFHKPELRKVLKEYYGMKEIDDRDPAAIEKMRTAKKLMQEFKY